MAGSNKLLSRQFCPLLDVGPPKGEVWVQVKKAKLPYHIEEMGSGNEGLRQLKLAQAQRTKSETIQRAIQAFNTGDGYIHDAFKAPDLDMNLAHSKQWEEKLKEQEANDALKRVKTGIFDLLKRVINKVWKDANFSR